MDQAKLHAQLILHEGLVLHAYKDTEGILTIGVGHNLLANPLPSKYDIVNGITREQALEILDEDLKKTYDFLDSKCVWWKDLDECRQRAIVDLAFDLRERLLGFKHMIVAIQGHEWNLAATELLSSKFAHQVGKRATDLTHQILTGTDL